MVMYCGIHVQPVHVMYGIGGEYSPLPYMITIKSHMHPTIETPNMCILAGTVDENASGTTRNIAIPLLIKLIGPR